MSEYGLPYMGSKSSIAASLAMNFPKAEHFYDLFGGYEGATLSGGKHVSVHACVALAFLGPALGRDVNHKNGDKKDNRIENLEYMTRLENIRHALYVIGHKPRAWDRSGYRNPKARIKSDKDIEDMLALYEELGDYYQTADALGFSHRIIRYWVAKQRKGTI